MYVKNQKHLPLSSIEQLHKNYNLLESFYLGSEDRESLLDQLDTAIYQTANIEVWQEAVKLLEALNKLVLTSMDTASNSAKYILKKAA